jgi:ketosteroid isomerase-like protein
VEVEFSEVGLEPLGVPTWRLRVSPARRRSPIVFEENKNIVLRYYQEVRTVKNIDLADELLTPGFVSHPSLPTRPPGPESAKQEFQRLGTVFSEWEVEVHSVVAEGEEVALRATVHATHVGPFMGIEPTGKGVSGREMFFCRLEGGKIAETWRMDDVEGFAAQLGG